MTTFYKTKHAGAKILIAFLTVCVSVLCMVGLVGCSGPTPTETTQQFLDGIKANDTESIQKVYAGDPNTVLTITPEDAESEGSDGVVVGEIQDTINNDLVPKLREFDYEITNEQIDGDTATVDVKITTYTVGDAFNTFITDYMSQGFTLALSGASEDDLSELASSIFSTKINSMEKSYTDTVTVSLSKVDGNWKVDDSKSNAELTDALLGGLYTTIESLDGLYE